jgi:dipeptidyl aminopeptidase/acylaminoacyl peptidase
MHGLQMAVPRWSPDGSKIAFIGGLMSDQGSTGGDVWLVPSSGGEAKDLTADRPASPAWIEWGDDGHLFVSETVGGDSRLVRLPVGGSDAEATIYRIPGTPADGRMELSLSSTHDHATFVFSASSFDKPAEVYAASTSGPPAHDFSGLRQLTHLNEGIEGVRGKTESLNWKSDQFDVQGWLHLPKGYDPAKKYPLIVLVHGGPAAAVTSTWRGWGSLNWSVYTAMG